MPSENLDAQRATAAEVVALTLLADGVLANREIEQLDRLRIAELLDIPRDVLIQAVINHCRRLLERAGERETVRLVDLERFEAMLDRITDPALRLVVCRAMVVLSRADGMISPPEQTLLRTALTRWGLSLEAIRT